jgi:arsenate reductase
MSRVLFVCKQNAGRSQMSNALFQRVAQGRHDSRSAGTRPAEQVHPVVADAMREVGIDISGYRPQKLTDDLGQWADVVVTMGCGEECPYIPGKRYIDWELTDPADKSLAEVRAIRDDIRVRVTDLVRELDVRSTPKKALSAN